MTTLDLHAGQAEHAVPTEEQIALLMKRFYDRVRGDDALGPVFNRAIGDWDEHLDKLGAFWSKAMLGTHRYHGNPAVAHKKQAEHITPAHFTRWLALWGEVTSEVVPGAIADALQAKAARMAEGLQYALFLKGSVETRPGTSLPVYVPRGTGDVAPAPYRTTQEFDEGSLPLALLRAHSTKAGVWGLIRVLEGEIKLIIAEPPRELLLTTERPGLLLPEQVHHVEPIGAVRMHIELYDAMPQNENWA